MPKTRKHRASKKKRGGTRTALNFFAKNPLRSEFIQYPPYFYENYESGSPYNTMREWMTNENTYWRHIHDEINKKWRKSNLLQPIFTSINSKYKDRRILPKGTIVYRAAFEENPCNFLSLGKDFVYFGLDFVIAVWYIKEALDSIRKKPENLHKNVHQFDKSYLHVYKLTQDLEYHYVYSDYPIDIKASSSNIDKESQNIIEPCYTKHCINPQEILHGASHRLSHVTLNVGTELTMRVKNSKGISISDYVQPLETYIVDQDRLSEIDALRQPTLIQDIIDVLIPYKTHEDIYCSPISLPLNSNNIPPQPN
jgi:hypothetical protein